MKTNKSNKAASPPPLMALSKIKNENLVKQKQLMIARKAAAVFVKKGYEKTTIRDIAKATGLAMGNLYDYIQKKEDILCLVFDLYHQVIEDSVRSPEITAIDDPVEQMHAIIRIGQRSVRQYRDEIMLMYRLSHLLPPAYLKRVMKRERRHIKQMETYIRNGIEKEAFKVKDPYFVASMMFALQASIVTRGWTFENKYSRKKVDKLLNDGLMKLLTT